MGWHADVGRTRAVMPPDERRLLSRPVLRHRSDTPHVAVLIELLKAGAYAH